MGISRDIYDGTLPDPEEFEVVEDTPSVVTLDLDGDTVGQCISVLRPLLVELGSERVSSQDPVVLAVYACDPGSELRWKHVWEYLQRNLREVISPIVVVYVGSEIGFVQTLPGFKNLPESVTLHVPAYIVPSAGLPQDFVTRVTFI